MDVIFLSGLTTECIIGIWDWERRVKQKVVIDLEMGADIRRAAASDSIEDTLDYKRVSKRLLTFVSESEFQLVETLTDRIAEIVVTEFDVPWVRVRLNKQGAIRGSRDVGILIERGSNVEPVANLRRALDSLAVRYPGLRCSRAYRNPAVGFEGEDFINLVLAFDTTDEVERVLERLHEAEALCGRPRHAPKWAPRSMDLDILLFGDTVCDRPGLVLPRPDLVRRAYMLGPAAEVAPDLVHPTLGVALAELWQGFEQASHPLEVVEIGWPARRPGP